MLRKGLRCAIQNANESLSKQRCLTSTYRFYNKQAVSKDNTILEELRSQNPMNAISSIQEYREKGQTIPHAIMKQLYEVVVASENPFYAHLFANLVSVPNLGKQEFVINAERAIKLYIAQNDWESCISFIQELEMVNNGNIELSYDTLESLILAAKWHGDSEIALYAARVLSERYPNVFGRTWGLVLQLALDSEDYEGLKWIHKSALIPGHLVADDASYLRIASIAANNGDLRLCEWSSLRMRRRQRVFETGASSDSMRLYICLIEAAASSSIIHADDKLAASFQAVCRYLIRLGPLAGRVSVRDLHHTVNALTHQENKDQLLAMFDDMRGDLNICNESKTIILNLLLAAELTSVEGVTRAIDLAQTSRSSGVPFNEDTFLLLLEASAKGGADSRAFEALVAQCPTKKVTKRAEALSQDS